MLMMLESIVGFLSGILPPARPTWDRLRWDTASFGALHLGKNTSWWNVFLSITFWKIT